MSHVILGVPTQGDTAPHKLAADTTKADDVVTAERERVCVGVCVCVRVCVGVCMCVCVSSTEYRTLLRGKL